MGDKSPPQRRIARNICRTCKEYTYEVTMTVGQGECERYDTVVQDCEVCDDWRIQPGERHNAQVTTCATMMCDQCDRPIRVDLVHLKPYGDLHIPSSSKDEVTCRCGKVYSVEAVTIIKSTGGIND